MKKFLGLLVFASFIAYGPAGCAAGPASAPSSPASVTDSSGDSSPAIIEGVVLRVHSSSYLIKNQSGKEVHVYFDQSTRQPDDIRRGEYITAYFDDNRAITSATGIIRGRAESTQAPRAPAPVSAMETKTAPPADPASPQAFEGEVLKFAGDSYVVRDMAGREMRLNIGPHTKIDGGVTTGNTVLVQTSSRPSIDVPYARQIYLLEDPQAIQGELIRIERNIYVLRDAAGKEHRLYVDNDSLHHSNIKPGDKIFVQTSPLPLLQPDAIIKR